MTATILSTILAADGDVSRYLFGMVLGGLIGVLIGMWKKRPVLGAVLGAFLGCIGWVIVAVLPKKGGPY